MTPSTARPVPLWTCTLHADAQPICTLEIRYELTDKQWLFTVVGEGGDSWALPLPSEQDAQTMADTLTFMNNQNVAQGYANAREDLIGQMAKVRDMMKNLGDMQVQVALILSGAKAVVAAERKKHKKGKP